MHNQWDNKIIFDNNSNPNYIKMGVISYNIWHYTSYSSSWKQRNEYMQIIINNLGYDNGYVVSDGAMFAVAFFGISTLILTISSIFFAIIGVFIILLYCMKITSVIYVITILIMIMTDLFGWMYLFSLVLDPITFALFVVSIGIATDPVVHVIHNIGEIIEKDNVTDITMFSETLIGNIGSPVSQAVFTTLFGTFTLIFSTSTEFRTFFIMMVGCMLFSWLHSIVFVPSMFSEILSFKHSKSKHKMGKQDESHETNTELQVVSSIKIQQAQTTGNV
eukprot:162244_1